MDDDFEFQLQQQALEQEEEAKKKSEETNPHIYRDPRDGTEYEWDHQRKAWFPKINDDFIAQYQASYGNFEIKSSSTTDSTELCNVEGSKTEDKSNVDKKSSTVKDIASNTDCISETQGPSRKRPANNDPPQWFDVEDEHNTNVYVSNLPTDITEEEFVTLMKKCGLIMKDEKNQLKIKLYRNEDGLPKGDGRCCYIKVESVELALNILDGYIYRENTIKVERAKFSLKGEYDPTRKPKKKKMNKKDKAKQKQKVEKLFDWRPDKLTGERPKHEKVVVIKNMFDPKIFERDPKLILEYQSDLREECEEKCGPVKQVKVYDLNPQGVATISFQEFDAADKCVSVMNGRFFDGRRLEATLWDGKTKYKIQETEEELEARMRKWDDYLEQSGEVDRDAATPPLPE